jgi:hypothetical protein
MSNLACSKDKGQRCAACPARDVRRGLRRFRGQHGRVREPVAVTAGTSGFTALSITCSAEALLSAAAENGDQLCRVLVGLARLRQPVTRTRSAAPLKYLGSHSTRHIKEPMTGGAPEGGADPIFLRKPIGCWLVHT